MVVHLDDFQVILGMEFLNAARALAILFDTMHPGKKMKFPSGQRGRGEDGDHLGATIQAWTRYTRTTY